jgi:hypothetical protein
MLHTAENFRVKAVKTFEDTMWAMSWKMETSLSLPTVVECFCEFFIENRFYDFYARCSI